MAKLIATVTNALNCSIGMELFKQWTALSMGLPCNKLHSTDLTELSTYFRICVCNYKIPVKALAKVQIESRGFYGFLTWEFMS